MAQGRVEFFLFSFCVGNAAVRAATALLFELWSQLQEGCSIVLMETYLPTLTVAGVLGFLAPLVSTAIMSVKFRPWVKQLIAILVSAVLSVVALLVTNGFTPMQEGADPVAYFGTLALSVIAVSQMAYQLVWKPTGVNDKVAEATQPGGTEPMG